MGTLTNGVIAAGSLAVALVVPSGVRVGGPDNPDPDKTGLRFVCTAERSDMLLDPRAPLARDVATFLRANAPRVLAAFAAVRRSILAARAKYVRPGFALRLVPVRPWYIVDSDTTKH